MDRWNIKCFCIKTKRNYCLLVIGMFSFCFFMINSKHHFLHDFTTSSNIRGLRVFFKEQTAVTSIRRKVEVNINKKHILLWTDRNCVPFMYLGEGNTAFVLRRCKWQNCYVTSNKVSQNHTEYDVVMFNGPQLGEVEAQPPRRSTHQKYVFASIESAANYPVCSHKWDGVFNWTWTYKIHSDGIWGYMIIRDANSNIIGPADDIKWIPRSKMDDISASLKEKLDSKRKLAAWFNSNCETLSEREHYVAALERSLSRYDLNVDIYGICGELECPKSDMVECLQMLKEDYYFYLAFENSLSEDYVTEKILLALNYNTVPIVFGGANYSRFMPDGSYLNALELGPKRLADKMFELVQDPDEYEKFFRWQKYYSYHVRHQTPETDDYCNFCAMINNDTLMNTTTIYTDFKQWWSIKYCPRT